MPTYIPRRLLTNIPLVTLFCSVSIINSSINSFIPYVRPSYIPLEMCPFARLFTHSFNQLINRPIDQSIIRSGNSCIQSFFYIFIHVVFRSFNLQSALISFPSVQFLNHILSAEKNKWRNFIHSPFTSLTKQNFPKLLRDVSWFGIPFI